MEVEMSVTLPKGHSLTAEDVTRKIRTSCGDWFEYALSTSHTKTILSDLYDADGLVAGELLATFQRAHRRFSPEEMIQGAAAIGI